ncbi:MAG: MOSC domain-containing protein [Pirellulaceae bacterium]
MSTTQSRMSDMRSTFPATGQVQWIGLRPGRSKPVQRVDQVDVTTDAGLVGDRFKGKPGADRQVTLIQGEHLDAVAKLLGQDEVDPALMRRNIVVSGINLTSLKGTRFKIGNVVLLGTGPCAPCSQMERNLGPGGYNAMRGHGGITACVVEGGQITVGDPVEFIEIADDDGTKQDSE